MAAFSNNRVFTLIELLAVIAVFSYVLAGLLFPVISRANSVDHKADRVNNQKQIGIDR